MVCCREIQSGDIEHVVDLLARGFTGNPRYPDYVTRTNYWIHAFKQLEIHPTPAGLPQYGYCLDAGKRIVGVVLLSFAAIDGHLRCNVSSWYVHPDFRSYGAILAWRATRHEDATFFNLTPAPDTWRIIEQHGFVSYAPGRFVAIPGLCSVPSGARIVAYTSDTRPGAGLSQSELDVLRDHAALDCMSLICDDGNIRHPFVFSPRVRERKLPICRLIYCRNLNSFVRFAGTLGRYLLWRGYPLIVTDAEGPIAGLVGLYKKGSRRYWKGTNPMRLGDMAYSEMVMFE